MNILFCDILRVKSLGTAATHMYGVLSALLQIGHNVTFINRDHPRNEEEVNPSPSSLLGRLKNSVVTWPILRPVGGEIAILWYLLRAIYVFSLVFIALVRHRGRFDVLYRRSTIINGEYLLTRMFNIPLVKEVNGIGVDEIREDWGWGNRISLKVLDKIERFNMPKADKIIVITSRLKEVLEHDYGVPGDKIVVIPNGANTDLFKPMDPVEARRVLGLSQSDYYVGFVGSLWYKQGMECYIRSMPLVLENLPNTTFLIVGDGIAKHTLINLAEQVGVSDKTIFTGAVPHHKVPQYVNASDVCIITAGKDFGNTRKGGSPLKLYEYMACGKPVIATNREGSSQDVAKSGSGLLINSDSENEMAEAIVTLLKNEQMRKEMGERAMKVAVEEHSWRKVAEQMAEVFQAAIKERRNA